MRLLASRFSLLALVLVSLIFIPSCEKEELLLHTEQGTSSHHPAIVFDVGTLSYRPKTIGLVETVLGPDRQNPFTLENMKAAAIAATGSQGTRIITDKYVVFKPQTLEHLLLLEEEDLFLLEFPWTKEIIVKGDYYGDYSDSTSFPNLYTVVAADYVFPSVPYELIANLDLSEKEEIILEEAFDRTGNKPEWDSIYKNQGDYCFENRLALECDDNGTFGGGTGGGGPLNACGCPIPSNSRFPSGCIQVEDTEFGAFQGVRRVRVVGKNSWFTWRTADTNDQGCWTINRRFSGKAWFWVNFKNEGRLKLRFAGVNGWRFWQKAFAGEHYIGRINGPVFNNILVRYNSRQDNAVGTEGHYTWAGATVNNALHEYYDRANAEGFNTPPDINTLVMLGRTDGFATMLRQMGAGNFRNAFADGVAIGSGAGSGLQSPIAAIVFLATGFQNTQVPLANLRTYLGDVNIGGNYMNSDLLKRLSYHEIGHSAHFTNAGTAYWKDVIRAEVAAGGHGDEDSHLAGHIQVAESWAEHIALTMTGRQYVSANQLNSGFGASNGWWNRLEELRNETFGHIPIGLYNDLIDGIHLKEKVRDENSFQMFELLDPVSGYSNAFFTSQLGETVDSPAQFRLRCLNALPTGVPTASVNALFEEY
ncbi:hypothetical protein QWY85_07570 [Neolewinella lacunae]|uniref:Uncharacterized protein n=1 Tax=Neolewinella lacunae TaxID=1517758 RepID=A0A923PID6_9BACT|nr:hypothetical protein [Neolewinella lacunae]MBC6994637.1 hypothetical protein [Neolewinella lacunae]MDN3634509.1 hypothetical protein [Neolewinella lacunae]